MRANVSRINKSLPLFKKISKAYISLDPLPTANGIEVQRQKVKERIAQNKGNFSEMDISSGLITAYDDDELKATAQDSDSAQEAIIIEEVRIIFGEELHIDPSKIRDTDHFIDDLNGDSLTSLGVFAKVEEKYKVIIKDTDYFACVNARDLAKLLQRIINGA